MFAIYVVFPYEHSDSGIPFISEQQLKQFLYE